MTKQLALGIVVRALAIAAGAASLLACGPAPGLREARAPAAVRVVPAEQVKGTCTCDDDDELELEEAPRPRRSTTYVKIADWEPPPQVQELEATLPRREEAPLAYTTFPRLTLHEPIGETAVRGRSYLRGFTHAR